VLGAVLQRRCATATTSSNKRVAEFALAPSA
jgi:hypothetical protein